MMIFTLLFSDMSVRLTPPSYQRLEVYRVLKEMRRFPFIDNAWPFTIDIPNQLISLTRM